MASCSKTAAEIHSLPWGCQAKFGFPRSSSSKNFSLSRRQSASSVSFLSNQIYVLDLCQSIWQGKFEFKFYQILGLWFQGQSRLESLTVVLTHRAPRDHGLLQKFGVHLQTLLSMCEIHWHQLVQTIHWLTSDQCIPCFILNMLTSVKDV